MAMAAPLADVPGPASQRRWAWPAIGGIAGLASGLLGVGGGFLMVPLLVVWARTCPHRAGGTSLAAILPIALVGAVHYYLAPGSPQADPHVALLLALGSVVGGSVGARSANRVPARMLRMLLAAMLAVVGTYELLAVVLRPELVTRAAQPVHLDLLHSALIVAAGAAIGAASGLTGLGGGILLVPAMVLGLGLGQVVAQGTSLFAILPTAAVGAVIHHRSGNADLRAAAWIAGVGAPAAVLGASLALALPQSVLVVAFSTFLLLAAGRLSSTGA